MKTLDRCLNDKVRNDKETVLENHFQNYPDNEVFVWQVVLVPSNKLT